jgi:hypothetical protein
MLTAAGTRSEYRSYIKKGGKLKAANCQSEKFVAKGSFLVVGEVQMFQQYVGLEVFYAFYQVSRQTATCSPAYQTDHQQNTHFIYW